MGEGVKAVMGSKGGGKSSVIKGSASPGGAGGGFVGSPKSLYKADKSLGTKTFSVGKRGLKSGRGM